jgi:hypothetical protein
MVAVGEFQSLMAKVAALEMIVEGLISERFEAELSPRAMGEAMIKSAIETEAAARVEHGYPASDSRVVGTANNRSISLEQRTNIPRSRQRQSLRFRVQATHPRDGHSGPAHLIPLALAKRPC